MSENRDPFSEIIGRALLDDGFRGRLMGGNNADQKAAMVDAGLTPEQADEVLPELHDAVEAIRALHGHEVFGLVKPAAA